MRSKRTVAVILALVTLLSACASVATPAPQAAGPTVAPAAQPTQAPQAAKPGEKKITFWHIGSDEGSQKLIQDSVDRFIAANPDVQVEVVPLQNDPFKTKLKVAMGAGDPPCIFPSWSGGPLYEYVKAGQVVDLTEWMNKDNYKNHFVDAAINQATFDSKIWGVPVENTAVALIFYNRQIFDKLGLKPPQTYDELLDIVKKLKDAGIAPFALANKTKWPGSMYYMYLVDRLGGPDVFRKAATRTGGSFEDPVFVEAGKRLQDLVKAGAFAEGYNGLDFDTGQSRMLQYSGKAAMELMGTWNIGVFKGDNIDYYNNNMGFFPFPALKDGKGDPSDVVGTIGDNFYSISTKCKYPQEAFALIKYLIDDQAVAERGKAGLIPPVKGFMTDDPVLKQVISIVENAKNVQLWYDQYLPPDLGEIHKDTSQALFGLTMTPEEAAKQMEAGAKKAFGK